MIKAILNRFSNFIFTTLALSVVVMISTEPSAHAYLDPGSGSLILQALLGGVAGLFVVFKMYWGRFKNFLDSKKKNGSPTSQN